MSELEDFLNEYVKGNPVLSTVKSLATNSSVAEYKRKTAGEVYKEMQKEVENMPLTQKMAVAAGHETDKLLSGTADVIDTFRGMFGDADAAIQRQFDRSNQQAEMDRAYAPFKENAGFVPQLVGSSLPYVLDSVLFGPYFAKGAGKVLSTADKGIRTAARETGKAGKTVIQKLAEQEGIVGTLGQRMQKEWVDPIQKISTMLKNRPPISDPFRGGMSKYILGDIGLGAIEGGLHYDNSMGEGALASGMGSAVGHVAKPVFHRMPSFYTENEKRLIDWGKSKGYRFLPGMETGHRGMQMFEQDLRGSSSWTDVINQIDQANKFVTNRVAFEQLGIPPGQLKDLNPDVLKNHLSNLSDEYDNFIKNTKVRIENEDLAPIKDQIRLLDTLGTKEATKIANTTQDYLDKLVNLKKSQLPVRDPLTGQLKKSAYGGDVYQAFRKDIKSSINQAYDKKDSQTVEALTPILKAIDSGIERGARDFGGEVGSAEWKDLNERWALSNLLMEEGMDSLGMVDPNKLSKHFMSDNPKGYLMETAGDKINEIYKAAKLNDIVRGQPSGGLFDEASGLVHNPSKMSTVQRMLTSPIGAASSFSGLPQAYMALYKSGWPSKTGLLNFDGSPFLNYPTYNRSLAQASQIYPSVTENLDKAYEFLSSLPSKIKDKVSSPDIESFMKEMGY